MRASSRLRALVGNVKAAAPALWAAFFLAVFGPSATSTMAQDLTGLARIDPALSHLADRGLGLVVDLSLSQPVPYR
ncbi:MAG: hypothetical protein ORN49_12105, partial [Rhodobacteraceae bacterium]|nr:hypothetical protein [Paracoccaceae bacterium]